jgi:uncharacterized C2H2 Zn-finger protein
VRAAVVSDGAFACGDCGKPFARRELLRKHVKRVHEERVMLTKASKRVKLDAVDDRVDAQLVAHTDDGTDVSERSLSPAELTIDEGIDDGTDSAATVDHSPASQMADAATFACARCDRSYTLRTNLRRHEKQVHAMWGTVVLPTTNGDKKDSECDSGRASVDRVASPARVAAAKGDDQNLPIIGQSTTPTTHIKYEEVEGDIRQCTPTDVSRWPCDDCDRHRKWWHNTQCLCMHALATCLGKLFCC